MSIKLKKEQYLENLCRLLDIKENHNAQFIVTYLLYYIKTNNLDEKFKSIDDADVKRIIPNIYIRRYLEEITEKIQLDVLILSSLLKNYDLEVLTSALNSFVEWHHKPLTRYNNNKNIEDLILDLLDVKDGSRVLYCYSYHSDILDQLLENKNIQTNIYMDMSQNDYKLQYSLSNYVNLNVYLELNNPNAVIYTHEKLLANKKFDRIYVESDTSMKQEIPFEDRLVRECLADNGVAVKLVRDNTLDTKDSIYKYSREEDLKMNILKSVIAIPSNVGYMVGRMGSNRAIVLYDSTKKNNEVMFVNATNECIIDNNRISWFTDSNIKNIVSYTNFEKTKVSKKISYSEIIKNETSLAVYDYIENDTGLANPAILGDVAKIFRGNDVVRIRRLRTGIQSENKLEKQPDGQYEYRSLSVTNFDDNRIPYEELPTVKVDKNLEDFTLKNGDLLINKNGMKMRIVLFDGDEALEVVADGNIIIIRLDKTKVNPLFIKIYLESDAGMKVLANVAQSGSMLRSINISRLVRISIPLPAIEKQNEFVSKYQQKINELSNINKELRQLNQDYFFN